MNFPIFMLFAPQNGVKGFIPNACRFARTFDSEVPQ